MVEQFGLATIPLGIRFRASAFTSGTTSGTSGSMRQALELSMTMAPALAAIGLYSRLMEAGVLDRTISTPANASGRIGSTLYDLPWKSIALPALRSEARNLTARTANWCSLSTCRIIAPTAPVAPTTATLGNTSRVLSQEGEVNRRRFQFYMKRFNGDKRRRGLGRFARQAVDAVVSGGSGGSLSMCHGWAAISASPAFSPNGRYGRARGSAPGTKPLQGMKP